MAKKTATVKVDSVTIEVPLGSTPSGGYELQSLQEGRVNIGSRGVHVDAQLGADAAEAFLRVRNGLRDSNAKLASGRPVWSNADAFRWIMEQVAGA